MGRVSSTGSDFCFVTSDNPRSEDPSLITAQIEKGVIEGGGIKGKTYQIIVDRREAIIEAARLIKEGDTLLIAGKGHEDYQIVGKSRLFFDDRVEAAKAFCAVEDGSRAA